MARFRMIRALLFVASFSEYILIASSFIKNDYNSLHSCNKKYSEKTVIMALSPCVHSRRDFLFKSFVGSTCLASLALGPHKAESVSTPDIAMRGLVEKMRGVSRILDELQQDIFNEDWEFVSTYPAELRAFVPVFTRYTDSKFSDDSEAEKNSRVALRYEIGKLFGAVERLKRASDKKDVDEALAAFAQISVAYDRYLKAGYLYDSFDPITSTEIFFGAIDNSALRFMNPLKNPPKIKDAVLVLKGPDKGKTGILIGVDVTKLKKNEKKSGIVKLDTTIGRFQKIREIKVIPYANIAKVLSEDNSSMPKT